MRARDKNQYIATANQLHDGAVVYFTGKYWSQDIEQSFVTWDSDFLLKLAEETIEKENLISLEAAKIDENDPSISPISMREKIKAAGPSINY